jgi:hypothetical protein
MAVSDHLPRTARWKCRVVTSDPVTQRIEIVLGDGAVRQVNPQSIDRWPIEGEVWTVYQENQSWILGQRWADDTEEFKTSDLTPGDMRLDSNVIYDADGHRVVVGKLDDLAQGKTLTWDATEGAFVAGFPESGGGVAFVQTIGDGTARVFNIAHGMGTFNVTTKVMTTALPHSEVEAEVEYPDINTVTVRARTVGTPLAAGEYTVVISGSGALAAQDTTLDTWHTVNAASGLGTVFQNSWSNAPADTAAAFRKDAFGRVYIRGLIQSGTVGQPAFTLPVGYRPIVTQRFATISNGALGYLYVDSSGGVQLASGSNVYADLSPISFDTETVIATPLVHPVIPIVTVLPTLPVDGQEVDLKVDAAGTYGGPYIWRCKYDLATAGSYKWHVQGAPLSIAVTTVMGSAAPGVTYIDVPGGPIGITVPYAGVYVADINARLAAVSSQVLVSYSVGATAAADAWSAQQGDSGGFYSQAHRRYTHTIATAGAFTMKYRCIAAGVGVWCEVPRLEIQPLRIG